MLQVVILLLGFICRLSSAIVASLVGPEEPKWQYNSFINHGQFLSQSLNLLFFLVQPDFKSVLYYSYQVSHCKIYLGSISSKLCRVCIKMELALEQEVIQFIQIGSIEGLWHSDSSNQGCRIYCQYKVGYQFSESLSQKVYRMRGNSRYREDKNHPISNILIQLGLSFANIVLSDFETLSGILWENKWVVLQYESMDRLGLRLELSIIIISLQ